MLFIVDYKGILTKKEFHNSKKIKIFKKTIVKPALLTANS
jgi:hypothetical protein|tara:strand:- start:655 stop:774 length:120 start_codon:yes stop_codon:yes gene_type:complete